MDQRIQNMQREYAQAKNITDGLEAEATAMGRVAYQNNETKSRCPFINIHLRDAWLGGWDFECSEYESENR